MQIISDNWSKNKIQFDTISFVRFYQEGEEESYNNHKHEIVATISKDAHPFEIAKFFKSLAKLVYSAKVRKTIFSSKEHYQFVLSNKEFDFFPVKWFTLIFDNGIKIDHDFAFDTVLIQKNDFEVPLGKFPHYLNDKTFYPIYREFKLKRNAYKFIANQALK